MQDSNAKELKYFLIPLKFSDLNLVKFLPLLSEFKFEVNVFSLESNYIQTCIRTREEEI